VVVPYGRFGKTYRSLLRGYIWSERRDVLCVISGFRREVDENCVILGYCEASSGDSLPTFRDKISGSILRGKKSKSLYFLSLEDGPLVCTETSVRDYHYLLRNSPEKRSSHLLGGGNLRLREIAVVLRTFLQFS
jgi:hypothetical protein